MLSPIMFRSAALVLASQLATDLKNRIATMEGRVERLIHDLALAREEISALRTR